MGDRSARQQSLQVTHLDEAMQGNEYEPVARETAESGEDACVERVATGQRHPLLPRRKEGPVLLEPLLFFKKTQEDGYFNFEISSSSF